MTTTTIEQYSSQIEQALRKSFNFGQTYWLQADSESIAQQNKSDETREKFNKFVDDIVFTLAPPAIPDQSNPASALEQYKERCLRVADLLRKENHGWNSLSYTQAINDFSTAIAALPLPVMPSQDVNRVIIPSALIHAACHAIDKKADAPNVLAQLRSYATGTEVMPEQAEPEGLTDEWLDEMMARSVAINGHKPIVEIWRGFAFRVLHKFGSADGAYKAFTHWYESDDKKQCDDLKQAAVAANARIAELEAENKKLKEGK